MNGPPARSRIKTVTEHLAIQSDHLPCGPAVQFLCPGQKAPPESVRVKRAKTRPKVSWLGTPLGKSKSSRSRSQPAFASPKRAISTKVSAPQRTAHRAMAKISIRAWRREGRRAGQASRQSVGDK